MRVWRIGQWDCAGSETRGSEGGRREREQLRGSFFWRRGSRESETPPLFTKPRIPRPFSWPKPRYYNSASPYPSPRASTRSIAPSSRRRIPSAVPPHTSFFFERARREAPLPFLDRARALLGTLATKHTAAETMQCLSGTAMQRQQVVRPVAMAVVSLQEDGGGGSLCLSSTTPRLLSIPRVDTTRAPSLTPANPRSLPRPPNV